jgi:hypothetical protein
MAGLGADPAALLRIYLDFDRLAEATALVLEYIRAWSTLVRANHCTPYRMLYSVYFEANCLWSWLFPVYRFCFIWHSLEFIHDYLLLLTEIVILADLHYPITVEPISVLSYNCLWLQKPADVIKRKHMCAVWFPYTLLDRLQSCLSKSSDMALRDKLQDSLKCALQNHFKQVAPTWHPTLLFQILHVTATLKSGFLYH